MTDKPRFTGQDERGKPRIRGNAAQYDWMVQEYRNMGLENQNPGDLTFSMPVRSAQQDSKAHRERGLRKAYDAERNSEMVRGGLDRKANSAVGPSLRPMPMPDITWLGQDVDWMLDYQMAASSAFQEWATDNFCRGDGELHYQFGGQMWQAFRSLTGPDSEVSGYIGYDEERAADLGGHKWATYVSLFDPARISNPTGTQDGPGQKMDGGRVVGTLMQGRHVDKNGGMLGMNVAIRHPSESGAEPLRWEYIPRIGEQSRPIGFHWFFKRRPGLQRAITSLAAVLSTVDYLSKFSDATLQTAISHAYMAAYVKTTMAPEVAKEHLSPATEDGLSEWEIKAQEYAKMQLRFGGKRVPILGPNDEIVFESLEGAAMDFDPFRNAFLRELASALGVSFEQLSLDFSRVSYSSARQSMIQSWANIDFERAMFTNHVASLVFDAVIEEAFMLGILKEPRGAPSFYEARGAYTRVQWIGPGMGWVDPLKEIDASKGRVGAAVSNLAREAGQQGAIWFDNIVQQSIVQKFADKHDVALDFGGQPGQRPSEKAAAAEAADLAATNANDQTEGQ